MPGTKVLDQYSLLAFLEDMAGADDVRNLLLKAEEGKLKLAITTLNLAELWHAIAAADSGKAADKTIKQLMGMAIEIVDIDWQLAHLAATLQSQTQMSVPLCYAAALAKIRNGEHISANPELARFEGIVKFKLLAQDEAT